MRVQLAQAGQHGLVGRVTYSVLCQELEGPPWRPIR